MKSILLTPEGFEFSSTPSFSRNSSLLRDDSRSERNGRFVGGAFATWPWPKIQTGQWRVNYIHRSRHLSIVVYSAESLPQLMNSRMLELGALDGQDSTHPRSRGSSIPRCQAAEGEFKVVPSISSYSQWSCIALMIRLVVHWFRSQCVTPAALITDCASSCPQHHFKFLAAIYSYTYSRTFVDTAGSKIQARDVSYSSVHRLVSCSKSRPSSAICQASSLRC